MFDGTLSIYDWQTVFLAGIEVGGEYLALIPKAMELLDAIKEKKILPKDLDEEYISSFLKMTIPQSIDKIINFTEITKQDEIDTLTMYFHKIIEIIPYIQTYLSSEFIESISQLFDPNSKIFQQNKSTIFYPKIVNSFINNQVEIINTLKSMNLNENINCCYFNYLISSIYNKIKQSKRTFNGLNSYLPVIINIFYSFINTNISNFHFFSNKTIIEIVSKTFDSIIDFLDKKETTKLYLFFEENLILQNINIQKFISQCLSKFCQNPKHASIIYSIISKSTKITDHLLSHIFNHNVLMELKQFYYFILDNGMISLKFITDFWNLYSKTQLFEKNDIYIDLIVHSLSFLDQNRINEFLVYVQNESSKFYMKLLSKIVLEFQNNDATEKYSVECLKLIFNFSKNNECAKNQLINLIENKLTDNLSKYLMSELLPLLKNNEAVDFACLIIDSIINSSSDPSNLIDKESIFALINKDNEDHIIHILIQFSLKTRTKLNANLFEYLKNKQNINDDIWNLLKEVLFNNIYQNNKEINKFFDIAKKQNIELVSLSFVKFLKMLIFKFSNENLTNNDFKSTFRIFSNSINGLDLVLNVYLCNNDPKIISSSKKFLLKLFKGWNPNNSVNYLNNQLNFLLEKEKSNEKLINFFQLILNYIQNEVDVDPEDFSCPRRCYPKNFMQLTIVVKNYSTFKIKYTIHFNKNKTLQNLKERISKIESININCIQFGNYSLSLLNKTLEECGITNNSEIEVNISSIEKDQNDNQKTPSFYFSQIHFQDKLLSILDKTEFNVNSIVWDILQLLPTSKSIMDDSDLNKSLIEIDDNYKKLYLIQTFCKKNNIFVFPNILKYIIDIFQMDYLKEPIIYILKELYKNEKFDQCTDISIMLIEFINQTEDDDLIYNILNLLILMSKNNNLDFIIEHFDKFESLNEKYFDIISNLFHCILENSQIKDEIISIVKSKIINEYDKSKLSLKIISDIVELIDKSNINSLYQVIINKFQIYIDDFNEQKVISQLFSDLLICLSNIIKQNEFLTKKTNFPVNFLTDILFDPRFNEMQTHVFKLINIYLQIVKNQDIKNIIISKTNDIIMNTNNSYNYDPLMNNKTEKYTGLQNFGATCYINSVLQQIYHLFPVRYLLSTTILKNCEFKVLQKIINQMEYTKRPFINTSEFVNNWKGWKNGNINPKEQQDSVEFFHYLIESFPKKIKDLFRGEIINYLNEEISSKESFYYLNIPIKDHNDIYSSFDSYIYKNSDEIMSSKISKLPSIFVVQLDRFEYSNTVRKINDKFIFPIELNIEQLCTDECKQNQNQFNYNLNGIIIHKGVANSGHYISLIRKENEWICFNDETVTKMIYQDAFDLSTGQKEIGSSAYVLFYTQILDDLKIHKQKKISFNEEFDFTKEINHLCLTSIFKDNEIWEKNQMLFDQNTIEFIQMLDNPLLNISFFIKVLCHSTNYKQSEIFISNLKKIIMDEFNSIDSSQLFLECADYLIENSEDIFKCYLHCSNSFLLSNLSNFILFFFNYLDKIMSLPENTILIDDEDYNDDDLFPSHEKSLIFFNKFGDQVINPSNSIEKVIKMIDLIVMYISKHTMEALNNGWTERLMKIIYNIYGLEISSKRVDYSKLNITNILNTLNSLFMKSYSVDSNYISNLIKYESKIKLSNENKDSYENMIMENIIPSINILNEDEEYSELEKISSENYLNLIKSLNIFNRSERIAFYSLLVFRKQKELLIFVANHNKDHCKILLKAKVSLFKKPYIESNNEKTFINEINLEDDNSVYCVTIHNIGEVLIAQNGDILLNNLAIDHSFLIKSTDSVIINSCNIKKLFVDSKNVIITNEDKNPTKIESLIINYYQKTSSLFVSNDSAIEINTLYIENSLITNYGSLLMTNVFCSNCSILNNGKIITENLEKVGFLFNTSFGTIESDGKIIIYAINLFNFGEIKCTSLRIIVDSTFLNNNNITTSELIKVYSENIENYGNLKANQICFTGKAFKQYQEGCITADKAKFNSNKTEYEGKLQISDISIYNDENSKTNKVIIFNNIRFLDLNRILIYQCCEVLIGENAKIMKIGNIINNGEFIIKTQISSITNIDNKSSGKLFIMNNINVKSIVNKGHIVVLGKKNNSEFNSLYVGLKIDFNLITLNLDGKFIGLEDSTLEIANEGVLYASEFQSNGLTFGHKYLNIYESHINNSNANNFYGLVASQDGITFNSYDKILMLNHQLIEPSFENKEKIFKVINASKIVINDKFNRNLNIIFETNNFLNNSCLVAKNFIIKTKTFKNIGKISCSDDIDIQCNSFINISGRIESHKNIIIKAENLLENKGGGTLKKNVTENIKVYEEEKRPLHMDQMAGAYSETILVEKLKTITKDIYSPQLDKSGVITTDNGKLEIYSKSIDNSFGIMNSKKGVLLNGIDIIKNECGLIVSGNDLIIKSKQFKNGHKGSPQTFSSVNPNKPIIKPGILETDEYIKTSFWGTHTREEIKFHLIDEKAVDFFRQNIHRLKRIGGPPKVYVKMSSKIVGYEKYNHTVESSQYPGYIFAQDNINIFSQTDIYLGTIVSGKNINIQGKNISSINIKDRGTIIANGNVNLEMKRASIEQAKIQAENISMKILESFTIEGVIHPVVLLDGSIILILDLKKFAEIIGIFSKNPNIAHELLDLTEVSVKNTKSSGFMDERPKSDLFMSSLPDEQMRNVLNLLLTPIHGRNILQNPHLIQNLEFSGFTADNSKKKKLIKNDNPMILYQKTGEEEVIINDDGEKQTVSIYNPQLIINTLNKAVSFFEAQKKISIESMKNIKINPGNFEFDCDISLKAKEKVSLMSKHFYDKDGNRQAVNKVNLKCNDLTISGNEGVELRAADINAKNINIISSNGDIIDNSMSLDFWDQKTAKIKHIIHDTVTSNINAQESISMDAKNIDLTGTNISAEKNMQFNAENIDFKPSYVESYYKNVSGRTKTDTYSKLVKPQVIKSNGNIEFNAKNVNLMSTNIFTLNSIKNNINGNFNISAAYNHTYAHSFYKKRRLFGSCSREQTEIFDEVKPAQIVAREIQSLGIGTVKIESAIIKTINMHITKDLIERSLENKYEYHDVIKRRGFFAPKVRGDPLRESLRAFKASKNGDILPQTIGLASSVISTCNHIKTLANLSSLPNPTMQLASVLLSRFTTVSLYSHFKQVHDIHRKIPVQSNVEVGIFKLKNNRTHLEGIWDIDKASIETDVLTAKSTKIVDEQRIKFKGWSIDFNLGSIISNFIIPCVFVPKVLLCMPSVSINKGKESSIAEKVVPMKLRANNLMIRCNDAVFSGAQIHSKVVDAIVEGKLTVESLTNLFDYKSKHSNITMGLSSIFGSVINETFDGSLFGKLKRVPAIRIANKTILSKKVEEFAELIGTEKFYLKVGELLYTNPSIVALLPEGSFVHSENEQIICDKIQSKKIEEVYQEKNKIINPSIYEMIQLMGQVDDYKSIQTNAIKEAMEKGLNSNIISKIEREISEFLNNEEIKNCIQEMNENLEKLDKSINNFSGILYDHPEEEKNMPQEVLYKYHSTSEMIEKQIHDSLKCGSEIFQNYDQFLNNTNSDMKHIYKNSLFPLSNNIIDGLVKVPITFCKDSLIKYQNKFPELCQSKVIKSSLVEELPDKIVDLAISYAKDDVEAKEFAKTAIFGLNNISSESFKIKNIKDFDEKIRVIEESVQENMIDKEKLRNESSQSISEFLNNEVKKTIKFIPIGSF